MCEGALQELYDLCEHFRSTQRGELMGQTKERVETLFPLTIFEFCHINKTLILEGLYFHKSIEHRFEFSRIKFRSLFVLL
jgi:hypothetical protein